MAIPYLVHTSLGLFLLVASLSAFLLGLVISAGLRCSTRGDCGGALGVAIASSYLRCLKISYLPVLWNLQYSAENV